LDLLTIAVGTAFCFAFVNGFHDGGNVIATIIGSRSMRPRKALFYATAAEFIGAVTLGTAVANTVAVSVLLPASLHRLQPYEVYLVVICAAGGAIVWKLPTWFVGLPSSSSHALLSGLVGAGAMAVGTKGINVEAVAVNLIVPLLISPMIGMVLGYLVFGLIQQLFGRSHRSIGGLFTSLQKPIMMFLAASQGSNDAQKSMGVIVLVLAAASGQMQSMWTVPVVFHNNLTSSS